MKKLTLVMVLLICGAAAFAQTYKKSPHGLEYRLVQDKPGKNAAIGDMISIHIVMKIGDSVFFDSHTSGAPVPSFQVPANPFNGDLAEGFTLMSAGDKGMFRVSADSIAKTGTLPEWLKAGEFIDYEVEMLTVKSIAEINANEQKAIADYAKKQNRKLMKSAEGVYYFISKKGTGPKPVPGDSVSMNYTGRFMNDTAFDSNVLPKFGHTTPFVFKLGVGGVIPGWDKTMPLFPKGTQATLYIPYAMAYGAQGMPMGGIPAFSTLLFDVEVVDVKKNPGDPLYNMPPQGAAPMKGTRATPRK